MEDLVKNSSENDLYSDDLVARTAFENFGIKYLFPWQRMVIANILEAYEYHSKIKGLTGEDLARFEKENPDSFVKGRQVVLLPTGAGKSLCFQVPALILDGPTMVIYPLLALMTDQQRRMEDGNLRSVTFRGGQTVEERDEMFRKIREGAKIILANPEVLQSDDLLQRLKSVGIKHIAIDEAHCVSEWGDSFRPAYLGLGKVIKELNPEVITAFTATASEEVLTRVCEILFDGKAHIVRSESDRQNIHYYVRNAAAKMKEALYLAKTEERPMIIFCGTRDKTESMARELNLFFGRRISRFYHAGLEKAEKDEIENWFFNSRDGILCATCAYGMGVDKKDIRTVVHIESPTTAEAYIQEAGRGGRDGSVAKAILLWSLNDSLAFSLFGEKSRQFMMKKFAETNDCRRQVLLDALGGEQAVCSGCDLCDSRNVEKELNALPWYDRNIKKISLKLQNQPCDYKLAYKMVRKAKNYYTKEELEMELSEKMNSSFLKKVGLRIWNHSDSSEVVNQLIQSNKIIEQKSFWWKGRFKTAAPS